MSRKNISGYLLQLPISLTKFEVGTLNVEKMVEMYKILYYFVT